MNIAQLEYFLAAARTLNYTKAANESFTSRQNLTRSIRDLEKELGVALFSLESGSLMLTVEGVEAAERARRILDEVRELKHAFVAYGEAQEPLNVLVGLNLISCTPYDISTVLETSGKSFHLGEYGCKTCYERIVDGSADVAVVGCMERAFPLCDSVVAGRDRLYLLVSEESKLAEKRSLGITDLAGHRLSILPEYEFQFEPLVKAYKACGLDTRQIDVISNVGLMLRAVRKDDAVGVASVSFRDNAPAGTKAIPLADTSMSMNVYILSNPSRDRAQEVAEFVNYLAKALRG